MAEIFENGGANNGISQFGYYFDTLATETIDEFRCVPSKCQAMSLSLIPKPGCLKEIKYKELANMSEVVLIDLLVKEGDIIPTIVDSTQRKGSILFMANDIEHMYEIADKICNNITFVYQDLSEWKPSLSIARKQNKENKNTGKCFFCVFCSHYF